jgi:hypothetical protein
LRDWAACVQTRSFPTPLTVTIKFTSQNLGGTWPAAARVSPRWQKESRPWERGCVPPSFLHHWLGWEQMRSREGKNSLWRSKSRRMDDHCLHCFKIIMLWWWFLCRYITPELFNYFSRLTIFIQLVGTARCLNLPRMRTEAGRKCFTIKEHSFLTVWTVRQLRLIDNSIYSGKPTSQVVFFRRSLRKLYKYKRLYNNNMHAGYMRCIYIYICIYIYRAWILSRQLP